MLSHILVPSSGYAVDKTVLAGSFSGHSQLPQSSNSEALLECRDGLFLLRAFSDFERPLDKLARSVSAEIDLEKPDEVLVLKEIVLAPTCGVSQEFRRTLFIEVRF